MSDFYPWHVLNFLIFFSTVDRELVTNKNVKKNTQQHTYTHTFSRSADGFKNIKQNIIQIILLFRRRSQEHVVKTNNNRVKYNIIMKKRKKRSLKYWKKYWGGGNGVPIIIIMQPPIKLFQNNWILDFFNSDKKNNILVFVYFSSVLVYNIILITLHYLV